MEINSDFWFVNYDLESFEKDFIKIFYNNYINLLTSNPDFKQIQQVYIYSQNKIDAKLQEIIV
jgi:hypothetical protein